MFMPNGSSKYSALSSIISSDIDIFFANTNVYESGKFKRALQ